MAEPPGWKTKEFHLEGVRKCHRPAGDCKTETGKVRETAPCFCIMHSFYAEASTTEEPDAGKPHVRVCAGGTG